MKFFVERIPADQIGGDGRTFWSDLKTTRGAIMRAERIFGKGKFAIWTFENVYDDKSYRRVV